MSTHWTYLPTWMSYPAQYLGYQVARSDHEQRRRHRFAGNFFVVILFVAGFGGGLAIWIGIRYRYVFQQAVFSPVSLGGSFQVNQAKAIDFAASAIFSQVVLEILNYFWFGSARVAAPSAHPSKDQTTTLHSMIAASTTDHGSYDIARMWALLGSRTGRISTMAWLSITAAVTKTAFSNLIAYEIRDDGTTGGEFTYRLLADPGVLRRSPPINPSFSILNSFTSDGSYDFNLNSTGVLAQQVASMLTSLSFQNGSVNDGKLSIVNFNATDDSLRSLMQSNNTIDLNDVDAYNASISCSTWTPTVFDSFLNQEAKPFFDIRVGDSDDFTSTDRSKKTFIGTIPGSVTAMNETIVLAPFIGFDNFEAEVYLGHAFPMQGETLDPIQTEFGMIEPKTFPVAPVGWTGFPDITIWGLVCKIQRQDGKVNLKFDSNSTGANSYILNEDDQKEFTTPKQNTERLVIKDMQIALNYQSPASLFPGIGGAIGASANPCALKPLDSACRSRPFADIDYSVYAENYLFAALQTERITLNVAGDLPAETRFPNGTDAKLFSVEVKGTKSTDRYEIVYVPVLLLVGLLFAFISSVIVLILSLHSRSTIAGREFRKVDSLRLLVDFVAGVKDDFPQSEWDHVRNMSNEQLEDWAKSFKVAYSHVYRDVDMNGAPLGETTVLVPRGHKGQKLEFVEPEDDDYYR